MRRPGLSGAADGHRLRDALVSLRDVTCRAVAALMWGLALGGLAGWVALMGDAVGLWLVAM